MLAIIFCMTPSFLTLAGGLIHIGNLKVRVATSIGFSVPISQWLKNELYGQLVFFSSSKIIKEQEIFNFEYINQLINSFKKYNLPIEKLLWSFLNFQKWYFKNNK